MLAPQDPATREEPTVSAHRFACVITAPLSLIDEYHRLLIRTLNAKGSVVLW